MRKLRRLLAVTALSLSVTMCMGIVTWADSTTGNVSQQATFSEYWYQDSQGSWHIKDNNGNMVTNAWLCDDAVQSNGNNVWYLIDGNGNMITSGLVQDQTGNYYSLETNHNGFYGMLRYQSGNYDNISLTLDSNHSGSFAAIQNPEAIQALQARYGLAQVSINNSNCVYTSSFKATHSNKPTNNTPNKPTSGQSSSSTTNSQSQAQNNYNNDNGTPNISAIADGISHGDPAALDAAQDADVGGAVGNHNWN